MPHQDQEPQTIRESGDPFQGAPNKHVSDAEWRSLAKAKKVEDEQGGTTAGTPGTDSFGTTGDATGSTGTGAPASGVL